MSVGIDRALDLAAAQLARLAGEPAAPPPAGSARIQPGDLLPQFLPLWESRKTFSRGQNTRWIAGRLESKGWSPGAAASMAPRVLDLLHLRDTHSKGASKA